jgi:hypothetical protein
VSGRRRGSDHRSVIFCGWCQCADQPQGRADGCSSSSPARFTVPMRAGRGLPGTWFFFSPFAVRGLCSPSCLSVLSILPPLQTRVFKKERKRSGHGMQAQHHGSLRRDRSNHSDTALVSFTPPWISQATGTHCSSLAL